MLKINYTYSQRTTFDVPKRLIDHLVFWLTHSAVFIFLFYSLQWGAFRTQLDVRGVFFLRKWLTAYSDLLFSQTAGLIYLTRSWMLLYCKLLWIIIDVSWKWQIRVPLNSTALLYLCRQTIGGSDIYPILSGHLPVCDRQWDYWRGIWNVFGHKNDVSDIFLVPLLLTLDIFRIIFWCFFCWLWTCKYFLGSVPVFECLIFWTKL